MPKLRRKNVILHTGIAAVMLVFFVLHLRTNTLESNEFSPFHDVSNVDTFSSKQHYSSHHSDKRTHVDSVPRVHHDALNATKGNGSIFVVIMAQMRTGSTIVGQMFNQHREFFYSFEPLHCVRVLLDHNRLSPKDAGDTMSMILYEISKCRFPPVFTAVLSRWGGRHNYRLLSPYCKHKERICKISQELLPRLCEDHKQRLAVKIIRADLRHLQLLVEDLGVDVRVIHLVRDPRGTANSRVQYELTTNRKSLSKLNYSNPTDLFSHVFNKLISRNIPQLCARMLRNLQEADAQPAWLRGRYKRVRYEDFAAKPVELATDVFRWLGLELPVHVERWLIDATNSSTTLVNGRYVDVFDQRKNATEAAAKWREILTLSQRTQVEDVCREAMDTAGYIE